MTPLEWGRLQGFIGFGFIDKNGVDTFSFPEGTARAQQYKQFGNSVAVPVVHAIAEEIIKVLDNTTDETGTIITDSRIANSDFTVGIHVPRGLGGSGCYNLFDSIIELLLFNTSFSISSVSSEEIEYIRNTDSLFLKASFTIRETLERDKTNASVLTIDK